jgi:translocation and assembly module TamB
MSIKRTIGWTFAGLAILLIVAVIAGYFYLRSNSFQRFAIREIVKQADQATGGRTEIGGLDFKLSTLTAHLYNITVRGTEGPEQPPLLHADELTVRAKIVSVLHHQISLRELLINHPVVHVQVDGAGKNNLPTAPPSKSSSHTSVFDLAVGHVQLSNGEVDYNDRKTPLNADLYDLGTDIRFASFPKRYEGTLSYRNGHLRYADYAPLPHNLNLTFSATPDELQLSSFTLRVGSSDVNLKARLTNYSSPVADGEYRIRIHTNDFAEMSPSVSPAGDVALTGKLHYRSVPNEPLMKAVSVDGQLASEMLRAVASGKRVEFRSLQGTYKLADGNLVVPDVSVESFGGRITANAEMKHLDTTPESSVHAALQNISLRAIQQIAGEQATKEAALTGTLNGKAEAAWKGGISNLRARSDLLVRAQASSRSNPSAHEVPVNGDLHVTYDGPRQVIEVHDSTFKLPSATVTAQGVVSNHSNLQIQTVANDLHQLATLAASFSSSQAPPAISGSATLNATVQGSMKRPQIAAQLNAQNLQVEGSEWKTAKIAMHADPSQVTIDNASLVNARQGQVNLTARVALRNWAYQPSNAIMARLNAQQLRLTDLQKLAKKNYPITGDISASVSLDGSQLQPTGSGSAKIANAHAYGETIQVLAAKFHTDNGSIISSLNVSAPAGAVTADLTYTPKTKAYKVRLDAPAVILQKLQTLQEKNLGVNGTISASVNGQGTVDDPQLVATVQLPQLQMRKGSISNFKADLRVAQHKAELNVGTNVSAASIRAHGTVNLTGDYEAEAAIDTNTISMEPVLATYAASVPQGFQGQTELHATLKGPLKNKSRLVAHVSVPVLQASYQALQIGIARPIQADYANSVITLQPAEIRGTDTSLKAQGRIPLAGNSPPTLTAQGSIDVRLLQIFAPTVQSSGVVALDVQASGTKAVQGQIQFKDVALSTADAPIGIEKLNGGMDITKDRVQISKMSAQVGGGQVDIGGAIAYKPSLQFNLAVKGKSVRIRYPEGLRTVMDTSLAFSGTTQGSILSGRVLVDSLSFTPEFDLASFGDQFSTGTTPSQPGFADTVRLAIAVQTQSSLNAVSSQVSIAGQANLQVGGTASNPVITGRTTLTSGELFFRNVRYQLQRGVITFDDPTQTHPVLNVTVTTVIEQYNLTLTMRGPLDKLTTEYMSDPPLATADVINLVARGKTTEEQAASSQSTDSMIASQVAGQLSSGIQKLAGISSLQIDPTLGGNSSNPSARVAIQQRVTKNLLFSFSTDVSQPGSEIVQGEYQINKRWSVSLERDQLGGISIDGKYHTRF